MMASGSGYGFEGVFLLRPEHFTLVEDVRFIEIVHVLEDKIEIALLAATAQIGRALSANARGGGSATPTIDHFAGQGVTGKVAVVHQVSGDPGRADLILLTEFAAAAGA